jgi:hypothetical protein
LLILVEALHFKRDGDWLCQSFDDITESAHWRLVVGGFPATLVAVSDPRSSAVQAKRTQAASGVFSFGLGLVGARHL